MAKLRSCLGDLLARSGSSKAPKSDDFAHRFLWEAEGCQWGFCSSLVVYLSIPLSICIYLSLHRRWRVWRAFIDILFVCRDASLGFVLKNASLLTSCNSPGQFTARTWLQHELAENIRTRNTSALILLSRSQDLYFLENATHPWSALR